MELMTIGMCLDYLEEYTEWNSPNSKKEIKRKATQSDFDNF